MRILYIVYLCIAVLFSGCASVSDRLYKRQHAFYAYIVGDVEKSHATMEDNADVYITPCSSLKAVTALAALKDLGRDYRFRTELWSSQSGRYSIIRFEGDITLTSEKLRDMLQNSKNSELIVDASAFGSVQPYSQNLMLDDIGTGYYTHVSPVIIDENYVTVNIESSAIGEQAMVYNDASYKIKSDVITSDEPTKIDRLMIQDGVIEIVGNVNVGDVQSRRISSVDMQDYVLRKMRTIRSEIGYRGKIKLITDASKMEKYYQNAKLVNVIESDILANILPEHMKLSKNLLFDVLYLTMGNRHIAGGMHNWNEGGEIIQNLITKHYGVDMRGASLVDGSGISRYNIMTSRQFFDLLKAAYISDVRDDLIRALPRGGVDGTLLNRALSADIVAKTGTMSGHKVLAGYNIQNKKNPKVFMISISDFSAPGNHVSETMDEFIKQYVQ